MRPSLPAGLFQCDRRCRGSAILPASPPLGSVGGTYAEGLRLLLRQLSANDGIAVNVPGFVAGSTPLIDSARDRMNHDTRRPGRVDSRGVSGEMGRSRYCSAECLFCLAMTRS